MFSHRIVHWKNRAANEIQVWRHIRDHYKQCSLKPTKEGASDESYKHHFFVSHRQDNGQVRIIWRSLRFLFSAYAKAPHCRTKRR